MLGVNRTHYFHYFLLFFLLRTKVLGEALGHKLFLKEGSCRSRGAEAGSTAREPQRRGVRLVTEG